MNRNVIPHANKYRAPDDWFVGDVSEFGEAADLVAAVRRRRKMIGQGPVDAYVVGRMARQLTPREESEARVGLIDPQRIVIPVCISGHRPGEVLDWLRSNADAEGVEIVEFL